MPNMIADAKYDSPASNGKIMGHVKVFRSKIEKAQRGIQGEKSSKDMASLMNLVSTIGAQASPKKGDGTRCPEG